MEPWIKKLSVKEAKALLKAKGVDATACVEKGHLLSLVGDTFDSREAADAALENPVASSSSSSRSAGAGAKVPSSSEAAAAKAALARLMGLPAQQLKYQAAVMKRDPTYCRKNNPQLAGATDEMIRAKAEEMEARAKELSENPAAAAAVDGEAQVDQLMDLILNHPKDFKKHLLSNPSVAGLVAGNEAQVDDHVAQLQSMAKTNEKTMRWCLSAAGKANRTITAAYGHLQSLTGGKAKYVCGALALAIGYVYVRVCWAVCAWLYTATLGRFLGGGGAGSADAAFGDLAAAPVERSPADATDPSANGDEEWAEF